MPPRAKLLFKSFKAKLQGLRLRWGKRLLDRPCATPIPDNIRSVLFLRQDGKIGDCIVSSFAYREIKRARPDIRIGVLCNHNNQFFFEHNPYIDDIYFVRPKHLRDYLRIGFQLRKQYDALIDPTVLLRNRDLLLLRLLAAPFSIGYLKADYRLFARNIHNTQLHFAQVYRQALELLGITDIDTRADLPADGEARQSVDIFLKENQLVSNHYTAINFFGASRSRCFGNSQIADMLTQLARDFPQQRFVLLGAPAFNDKLIQLAAAHSPQIVCFPATRISQTIEIIRSAHSLISPDTATVHIADAFHQPILAFYREDPQNFANWQPQSPSAQVLFYRHHINEVSPEHISRHLNHLFSE